MVSDQAAGLVDSWREVVERADQALYSAKHGGRNAWVGVAGNDTTNCDDVRC